MGTNKDKQGEEYIQICLEGALQQVLQFLVEWNLGHDMPHHKLQQQLASELSLQSPIAGHTGQLKNVNPTKSAPVRQA